MMIEREISKIWGFLDSDSGFSGGVGFLSLLCWWVSASFWNVATQALKKKNNRFLILGGYL